MDDQMSRRQSDLEKDLETALRFERIERSLEKLTIDLAKNTASTADLLTAWNSSNWLLSFIKGAAVIGGVAVAIYAKFPWGGN